MITTRKRPYNTIRSRLKHIAADVNAGRWRTAEARLQGKSSSSIWITKQLETGHCMSCALPRPPELALRCRMHQDLWNASNRSAT